MKFSLSFGLMLSTLHVFTPSLAAADNCPASSGAKIGIKTVGGVGNGVELSYIDTKGLEKTEQDLVVLGGIGICHVQGQVAAVTHRGPESRLAAHRL